MRLYGRETLVRHMDPIKDFGFQYASQSGITFSWDELRRPDDQRKKIQEGFSRSREILARYEAGYLSLEERKRENVDLWQNIKLELSEEVKDAVPEDSSIGNMIHSGARGSFDDLSEMSSMFGIVKSASGESIEQPVVSSLKDGMTPIEYFNASFGARKGLADTALKTGEAGYLSRKLFSVAQEIRIEGTDCGTSRGFRLYRKTLSGVGAPFSERILGRFSAEEITGGDGEVLVKKGQHINAEIAERLHADESVDSVKVRSPITCQYARGVCTKCYGEDRSTGKPVDIGEPVGTVAAQSVGEPGTQLTMRTFHTGGVATAGGDITSGLPRVTEVLERRTPKYAATIARINGTVESIERHTDGSHTVYLTASAKKVASADKVYAVPVYRHVEVKVGDEVKKGQFLTDGAADLQELLTYAGREVTQEYIFNEINEVYELQGINIAPAHFEIIIRQMFSQLLVVDPGDGTYTAGEFIELAELIEANEELEKAGKQIIQAEDTVSGITNISVSRNNFLSAASFQNTTSVLIRASVSGAKDTLDGVKENVRVGRLVPVGSGFEGSMKHGMVEEVRADIKKTARRSRK